MKRLKNNKAFTLVELVIVMAVIAILAAVLLPTFAGMMNNARESARIQQVTTARNEMLSLSDEAITILDLEGYTFVIDNKVYSINNQGQILVENDLNYLDVESSYEKSTTQPTNNNVIVYLPRIREEIPLRFMLNDVNKTAMVYSYLNTIPSDYSIPSYIGEYDSEANKYYYTGENTYKIVGIDSYAFSDCNSLVSITLPDTITYVGSGAFSSCISLKSITLPKNLETIELYTFQLCSSLTDIVFPENLKTINDAAFCFCTSLTNVILPNSLTFISSGAFADCYNLKNVKFSENLEFLGDSSFQNCISLTSVELPESLTRLGMYAFYQCTSLTTIVLPSNLSTISDSAFMNCESLKNVSLPNNLKTIESYAFAGCYDLTSIRLPKTLTSICTFAFPLSNLTEIIFEHGATDTISIDCFAFESPTNTIIKCQLDDNNLPLNTYLRNYDWSLSYRIVTYVDIND